MKMFASLAAFAGVASAAASDHWAVIVAGSNTFPNYRHQADVCHAYQIVKQNGIPEEQIIMLSYDDAASSSQNPFPGKLFNKPTEAGTPGVDVNDGCNIDYKGQQVNKDTLLAVLKGDAKTAGGKVLGSNQDSEVFFYFADHGAPGLVAMPVGKYLMADELNSAFEYMHSNQMFKQMTVYMEACESGSMFQNILKTDINVYAVSAANAHESSWGTYCSPNDKVDGKRIGSCLGDLFSVNWMENTDAAKMGKESLQDQWKAVAAATTKSQVLQWGETDWTTEPIGEFQGTVDEKEHADFWDHVKHFGKSVIKDKLNWEQIKSTTKNDFAVDSRDNTLQYHYNNYMHNATEENQANLSAELEHRSKTDATFEKLFPLHMETVKGKTWPNPTDFDCLRQMIDIYEDNCEKFTDYSLKWVSALVTECEGMKSMTEAEKFAHYNHVETTCKSINANVMI